MVEHLGNINIFKLQSNCLARVVMFYGSRWNLVYWATFLVYYCRRNIWRHGPIHICLLVQLNSLIVVFHKRCFSEHHSSTFLIIVLVIFIFTCSSISIFWFCIRNRSDSWRCHISSERSRSCLFRNPSYLCKAVCQTPPNWHLGFPAINRHPRWKFGSYNSTVRNVMMEEHPLHRRNRSAKLYISSLGWAGGGSGATCNYWL